MWSNGSDLASWVDKWADHQPDALAIEFEGDKTNYRQLSRRIASIAGWLHLHEVKTGDRVAWLGPNHPLAIELLLACSRLGAIFLPLNSRLLIAEHHWILQDAGPRLLIAHKDFHEHATEAADEIPVFGLDEVYQSEPTELTPRVSQLDDPVLLAYTSGTTGTPKGALLSQSALAANAINGAHAHDLTSSDRFLTFLPLFHVGGLNIQTLPALMGGASVLLHSSFDPGQWLEDVERWQPTWSLFVPATLNAVTNHPAFAGADLSSLKGLMAGSSTIPEAATRPFFERGVSVGQVYGATETSPTAVVLRIDQAAQRHGSCGKAATLCDVRIVDDAGVDVAAGESGELWVRGPNVLMSYWRNPDATSESMTDGWFHTGDIGHMDSEGWIYIDDRKKDVVISGGENIYPAELENVLAECALLSESTVVGVTDSHWGEIPVVVAVAAEGFEQNSEAILQLFDGQIAGFKHPKRVIWTDQLPRNVMGKVLKHEVRDLITKSETAT